MQPQDRALAVAEGGVARGEWRAPGSKSIAQRALVFAALAHGTTRIAGLPGGEDVAAALRLVRDVGAELQTPTPATAAVVGRPPAWRGGWRAARLDVGESATLARLAIATAALCSQAGSTVEVHAHGTLLGRRTDALLEALASGGVEFSSREWPLRFVALGPATTVVLANPASSQEASALAAALASYPDENELVLEGPLPSRPYFDMTRALLERFGARLVCVERTPRERWRIRGPLRAPETPLAIEPDASLAAVALGAACLSGGEVLALGLGSDSVQGDVRIAEHLRALGCRAHFTPRGLVASGFPQHGVELDLAGEPDLAPVIAALAAGAALVAPAGRTRSILRGLETLNRKESRRLDVLADAFARAGWSAAHDGASLTLDAPRTALATSELRLDPHGDHRMAFAFALLGQLRSGVVVTGAECVAKSWPSFWREMGALGLRFPPCA
jgi:3-phosphoshikimate 1-carboxyvinyltransferase